MNKFLLGLGCVFVSAVLSCHSGGDSPTPVPLPVARKVDTARFPMQAVVVVRHDGFVDLRLPYTMLITTDSSKQYLVLGNYNGEQIGFWLLMKSGGFGVIRLTTMGKPSDLFLSVFRQLYGLEAGNMSHFADTVMADCISMGAYVDSLKKNGQGEYEATAMNKLFFEPNDTVWEAECYLNINPGDHWIELKEKDGEYQPKVARDLSKRN
jgi:hypothetical protein